MKIPEILLSDGNKMPVLGLGTWQSNGTACEKSVKTALKLGYRLIDTADYYGNHEEIARAIAGFAREELFLTTKLWANELTKELVQKNSERFLKELKTDYLDLLLVHWPNWQVPIKETIAAMLELQEQGKVKSIGVSNFSIAQTQEAINAGANIVTNQVLFHPGFFQKKLLDYCDTKKVKITAYSPIARGNALSNTTIKKIAEENDRTPAQVCLRWALQKGTIVIPKASSKEHLLENMQLFDWKLEKKDEEKIDALGMSAKKSVFRKLVTKIIPFYKI